MKKNEACPLKVLGEKIRSYRVAKGLTQDNLSSISGLDRSYISGVENGVHNITFNSLCRITIALGVNISDLVESIDLQNNDFFG